MPQEGHCRNMLSSISSTCEVTQGNAAGEYALRLGIVGTGQILLDYVVRCQWCLSPLISLDTARWSHPQGHQRVLCGRYQYEELCELEEQTR